MPDLTVARRQIYFDRQLVAELHPSLAEGTSLYVDFLGTLHTGADFDHVMEEIEQRHAADIKQLEDEIGAAEEQASEALAERDRAERDYDALRENVRAFLADLGHGRAPALADVMAYFQDDDGLAEAFEGAKKDAD